MKHFLLFALIFVSGFAADARADYTHARDVPVYSMQWGISPTVYGETPVGTCTAHAAAYSTAYGIPHVYNAVQGSGTSWQCQWKRVSNNQLSAFVQMGYAANGCHDGDTLISGPLCLHPEEGDPCPPGQVTGPGGICVNETPDEDPCDNVLGYVNGVEVCGDDRDDCEAQGGSYGIIMDEVGCLMPPEDPPECDNQQFVFGNDYGGYVCVRPDPKGPNTEDPTPTCPEGAIPAGNTCVFPEPDPGGDEDGDGTNNGDDDDDDGDGVGDENDPDRGAGQCDPTAIGYAQCIGQSQQISSTLDKELRSAANLEATGVTGSFVKAVTGAMASGTGVTEPTGLGDRILAISGFTDSSCVDLVQDYHGMTFGITCEGTAKLREYLAWIFAMWTLFYLVDLAFTQPQSKV